MKKQLTMIKVAGVAVSLAAAGIAGMASATEVLEHTADYEQINPADDTTLAYHDDVDHNTGVAGDNVHKVEGSDKITVNGVGVATEDYVDAKIEEAGAGYDDTAITQATATAQSTADNAQTSAEAAAASAIGALGAANGAQTAAENAQATADTAKSTADGNATHLGTVGAKVDANTEVIKTKQDQLTQDQLDSFTADSDTQLTEAEVDAFVDNNGYATTAQS